MGTVSSRSAFGINHWETNAVMKIHTFGMGAVVTAAAFSLMTLAAAAQQPPAVAPAPAAKPVTPPAPPAVAKQTTQAPAVAKPATPAAAAAKKAVSSCKGLDETGCKANPECAYVVPKDANNKTGAVQKPYCRKVAGVAKKAADAKAAAPAVAKPATTAPVTKPAVTAPAVKPAAPAAPKQ